MSLLQTTENSRNGHARFKISGDIRCGGLYKVKAFIYCLNCILFYSLGKYFMCLKSEEICRHYTML